MSKTDELNFVQKLLRPKQTDTEPMERGIDTIEYELEPMTLETKPMPSDTKPMHLDTKPMHTDTDLKPSELRTMQDWAEIIPEGTKSKVAFTVNMASQTNVKFNEILVYYQNRYTYGKVYKHVVIAMIIEEVYDRMKKQGLV